MNSVNNILNLKKKKFTNEVRLKLKNMGAPRPNLQINQQRKNTKYFRRFNTNMYKTTDWMCGCEVRNALFCFNCLVMGCGAPDLSWTMVGVQDLKNLSRKVKQHQSSENHIICSVEFNLLGRIGIKSQLSSAYQLSLQKHNESVRQNRQMLSKLIDRIKFCDAFELVLCGHNDGIFPGLVNLHAQVDSALKRHINGNECKAISELSKTIQNDLLDSILAVCLSIIKKEIDQTQFIAIQANETSDSATSIQKVLIVRYELNGVIYERFLGYLSPTGHGSQALGEAILNELEKMQINANPAKVIAQSYDGVNEVPVKIQQIYPNCNFVHCYTDQLNLIIERVAAQNKQIKIFFMHLEGFSNFFSRLPTRTKVLDDVVRRRLPQDSSIRWTFNERTVSTVSVYKNDILTCLEEIIGADSTDSSSFRKAVGLRNILRNSDFNYWIDFFNKLMPDSQMYFNQLYLWHFDTERVKKRIETFTSAVQHVRDAIDCDYYNTVDNYYNYKEEESEGITIKRQRLEDSNSKLAKEVCDVIINNIENRFSFTDHLSASLLFETELFSKHQLIFPKKEFDIAVNTYKLDASAFKHELAIIYKRDDFAQAARALTLLQLFTANDLISTFPESVKLLKIICTIPMVTTETERCCSTLKRIKIFTQNTVKQDRLYALAMCSIEKELIQSTDNFNDLVIDHFVKQQQVRVDFVYKTVT